MKNRADVVSLPEIAALRRSVHAAHARMKEAEKRSDGRGVGDHTYPTNHTGDERKAATAEWKRLTDEYEARVSAEMKR